MTKLFEHAPKKNFNLIIKDVHCCFCNKCGSYWQASDFQPSMVRRKARICRACEKKHRPAESTDPFVRMRRALYKALYAKGFISIARSVTIKMVEDLLLLNKVKIEQVKRIKVPSLESDIDCLSKYKIVTF